MTLIDAYAQFTQQYATAAFFKRNAAGRLLCTDLQARAEAWSKYKAELRDTGKITVQQHASWGLPWTRHSQTR